MLIATNEASRRVRSTARSPAAGSPSRLPRRRSSPSTPRQKITDSQAAAVMAMGITNSRGSGVRWGRGCQARLTNSRSRAHWPERM